MKGKFIFSADIIREQLDWGELGWITQPATVGAKHLTTIVTTVIPGKGHDFHKHPDQEETIYVLSGEVEQWLETEKQILRPGDTIFIAKNIIHASFCFGDQPAKMLVSLGPCVGEGGYEVVEVADQAPWNTLR
jgi:quercetin dioxygenase-like cupin family protein